MQFEIQNFNSLLQTFNVQTDAYCATLQQNLSTLLRSNAAFCTAFQDKFSEVSDLKQQNQQNFQNLNSLQFTKQQNESELNTQLLELNKKCEFLTRQITQLKAEIDQKKAALKQNTQKSISAQTPPKQLTQKFNMYKKMLKMDIQQVQNCIKIIFFNIGKTDQFIELEVQENGLEMKAISRQIDGLDEFLDEFEMTGNLGLLVRRVRRGFVMSSEEDVMKGK